MDVQIGETIAACLCHHNKTITNDLYVSINNRGYIVLYDDFDETYVNANKFLDSYKWYIPQKFEVIEYYKINGINTYIIKCIDNIHPLLYKVIDNFCKLLNGYNTTYNYIGDISGEKHALEYIYDYMQTIIQPINAILNKV